MMMEPKGAKGLHRIWGAMWINDKLLSSYLQGESPSESTTSVQAYVRKNDVIKFTVTKATTGYVRCNLYKYSLI